MLILSRSDGELTYIFVPGLDQPIIVKVAAVRGKSVKLAFDLPDGVDVRRDNVKKDKDQ